jgi:twitching motility protein PilT
MPDNDLNQDFGPTPLISLEALPIDQLLEDLVLRNASDIHLRAGEPPTCRVYGELIRTQMPVLTGEEIKKLLYSVMNDERRARFERTLEMDMSYAIKGVARFRISVFRQRGEIGAALRVIPLKVKSIDEWGLPPIIRQFATLPRGLILVTGPTGSGKSTTLAAMLDYINESRRSHIITIEDPLEYVHNDKQSAVEQRELGVDTRSFASALNHVMRQNPDVIMVGELRDPETMSLAMSAAETGHLVLSTLHTMDASQTVGRIIDAFEPEEQAQVRLQLSTALQGVVSQTLLRRTDGPGLVAAFEIMTCTPAIKSLIREGKSPQIYSLIQTGSRYGMQTLDQSLKDLLSKGIVSAEDALARSANPQEFEGAIAALQPPKGPGGQA